MILLIYHFRLFQGNLFCVLPYLVLHIFLVPYKLGVTIFFLSIRHEVCVNVSTELKWVAATHNIHSICAGTSESKVWSDQLSI